MLLGGCKDVSCLAISGSLLSCYLVFDRVLIGGCNDVLVG